MSDEIRKLTLEELKKVQPGPIQHQELSADLLARIRIIYLFCGAVVGDTLLCGAVVGDTLEQCEIGFMRDLFPEREVLIWEHIIRAYKHYHAKYGTKYISKDLGLTTLVAISSGMGGEPDTTTKRLRASWLETAI